MKHKKTPPNGQVISLGRENAMVIVGKLLATTGGLAVKAKSYTFKVCMTDVTGFTPTKAKNKSNQIEKTNSKKISKLNNSKPSERPPVSRKYTLINIESPYSLALAKKMLLDEEQICIGITIEDDEESKIDLGELKGENCRLTQYNNAVPHLYTGLFRDVKVLVCFWDTVGDDIVDQSKTLIEALRINSLSNSIELVVWIDPYLSEPLKNNDSSKARKDAVDFVTDFLDNVGIGYCIFKSNVGFEWINTLTHEAMKERKVSLPFDPDQEINWTCYDDIMQAIANVIKDRTNHTNVTYTLTSQEQITISEISNQLGEALTETVEYEKCECNSEYFTKKGKWITPKLGETLESLYSENQVGPKERTDDLPKLLGRDPITFKEWIKPNSHLFL